MGFLRHRDHERDQRRADRLTPVPADRVSGVMSLCALDPVSAVSLVQQMQRWSRWGRGDVVALGGLARPVAAAWSVGSLMLFGLAGRPEHGLRAADAGEIWALAEHAGPRLSRRGSVSGPAQDVAAVWGALSEQGQRSRHERWRQPVLTAPHIGGGLVSAHLHRRPSQAWVGQSVRPARPDEEELVLAALRAGANGFLLKDASAQVLLEAVRTVARGGSWLDPAVTGTVLAHLGAGEGSEGTVATTPGSGPGMGPKPNASGPASAMDATRPTGAEIGANGLFEPLTGRERDVLSLVCDGLPNAEIGERLHLAESTVKTHVKALLAKTGCRNRVELIVHAFRHGLVAVR